MGRHEARGDEPFVAHHPVAPRPPLDVRGPVRRDVLGLLGGFVLSVVLVAALLYDDHQFWGQPQVPVTVTAERPIGQISQGRSWCDGSSFTVHSGSNRHGSFEDCADDHAVGDRTTARWSTAAPDVVGVDVLTPGVVAGLVVGWAVLLGLIGAVAIPLDVRAHRRRQVVAYRLRGPPEAASGQTGAGGGVGVRHRDLGTRAGEPATRRNDPGASGVDLDAWSAAPWTPRTDQFPQGDDDAQQ
jgi:hypothetical protein